VLAAHDIQDTSPYLSSSNLKRLNAIVSLTRVPFRSFMGRLPASGESPSSEEDRRVLFKEFNAEQKPQQKLKATEIIIAAAFILQFIDQVGGMLQLGGFPWTHSRNTQIDSDTVAEALHIILFVSLLYVKMKEIDDEKETAAISGKKHHAEDCNDFKKTYRLERAAHPNQSRAAIIERLAKRETVKRSTLAKWAKKADDEDGFVRKGGRPKKG